MDDLFPAGTLLVTPVRGPGLGSGLGLTLTLFEDLLASRRAPNYFFCLIFRVLNRVLHLLRFNVKRKEDVQVLERQTGAGI